MKPAMFYCYIEWIETTTGRQMVSKFVTSAETYDEAARQAAECYRTIDIRQIEIWLSDYESKTRPALYQAKMMPFRLRGPEEIQELEKRT